MTGRGALLICLLAHQAAAASEFADWPPSWTESYRRFEAYIAARRAMWPVANIEILPEGRIAHGVRLFESTTEHLTLQIFRRGRLILATRHDIDLLAPDRERLLKPGIYAAGLHASGFVGYQHLYPLAWFEVIESPIRAAASSGDRRKRLQPILPPAGDDSVWPNERLLLFLDFHIFPKRYSADIEKANARVMPAISLRVDDHGVIERDKLADETAERLLHWRIYHDGRLVEKGSAAGVTRLETDRGVGTYLVFAGVEGANGFMPVSNLVEYPLFPGPGGKSMVFPEDSDGDGVPDFGEKIAATAAPDPVENTADTDGDGLLDREENVVPKIASQPGAPEETQRMIELWDAWSYDLRLREKRAEKRK